MNRTFALAVLLAAPSSALAGKTEAILAFDETGTDAARYYSLKGAARTALPGEPGKVKVDAVKGSPVVTAILVTYPGSKAPDRDEAQARLFAFGDTVNARVRQASGGKRSIMGDVIGPVAVAAPDSCDLAKLFERAAAASKADFSETDVALVIAPKGSCRYSGAATLGRVSKGARRMAVAWAFGEDWVASASHAVEHAMGARHAAGPASEDFGWASAAATAPKAPVAARRSSKRGHRVAAARKAAPAKEPMLTLAAVLPMIDSPEAVPPGGLRDAPAALAGGAALGFHHPAAVFGKAPGSLASAKELRPLDVQPGAPKARAIDAASCRAGVKNLRDAIKAADAVSMKAGPQIARHRLAEALKRQQRAMSSKDISDDVEVSLLTTDAESELSMALMKLESPKLTAKAFRAEVLPAAARAAASLEQAARYLSARK